MSEELQIKSVESKVLFGIDSFKSEESEEGFVFTGYANTKNKPDSYGDIPKGDRVYNLKRYKKNPVILVDHLNSAANIAGTMVKIKEDENGLAFKAKLMKNPKNPLVAHAIEAFKEGHGRALSIGGIWHYEDADNPAHLTKADISEISLVGVGADERALGEIPIPKKLDSSEGRGRVELKDLIKEYRETNSIEVLKKINEKRKEAWNSKS